MKNLYLVHLVSKDITEVFRDRSTFLVSDSSESAEKFFRENSPHTAEELEGYEIFVHDVTRNYLRDDSPSSSGDIGGLQKLLNHATGDGDDYFVKEVKNDYPIGTCYWIAYDGKGRIPFAPLAQDNTTSEPQEKFVVYTI